MKFLWVIISTFISEIKDYSTLFYYMYFYGMGGYDCHECQCVKKLNFLRLFVLFGVARAHARDRRAYGLSDRQIEWLSAMHSARLRLILPICCSHTNPLSLLIYIQLFIFIHHKLAVKKRVIINNTIDCTGLPGWDRVTSRNNFVKTSKDRHILSAVQIFGRDSSFWQYKDIRSGSLERRR